MSSKRPDPQVVSVRLFWVFWCGFYGPPSTYPLKPTVDETLRLAEKRVRALWWLDANRRPRAQVIPIRSALLRKQAG